MQYIFHHTLSNPLPAKLNPQHIHTLTDLFRRPGGIHNQIPKDIATYQILYTSPSSIVKIPLAFPVKIVTVHPSASLLRNLPISSRLR